MRNDTPGDLAGANQQIGYDQLDSAGSFRCTDEGGKATYYSDLQFAIDSTGTDIWVLAGNATTVVKVLWLTFSSVATAQKTGIVSVLRRSTADTGQTAQAANTPAFAKADARNAAASSVPQAFTAHPTALGTLAGTLVSYQYGQQAANTVPTQQPILVDFRGFYGAQGLRLNGVLELLYINAAAVLGGTGNAWNVSVCWCEEPTTA